MPKSYNPTDWYWVVAGSDTQVYSSKDGDYVPVTYPTYVAWAEDGTLPTRIDTEDSLAEVLASNSVRPVRASLLGKYKGQQASRLTLEVVVKVLFNHENRIRQQAGQPTVTPQQFLNVLKGMV